MKEIKFEIKIPKIALAEEWKLSLRAVLSFLIIVGAFIAKQNFDFTIIGTLILAYFGISIIWRLDSRISAFLALFFLVSCPILLLFKNDALAETFAIYAYYFLVITVFSLILDLKKGKISPERKPARGVDNFSGQPKRKVV